MPGHDRDPWAAFAAGRSVGSPGSQQTPQDPWEAFAAGPGPAVAAAPEPEGRSFGEMLAAPFKGFGRGVNRASTSMVPQLTGNLMEAVGDVLPERGVGIAGALPAALGELMRRYGPGVEAAGERRGEHLDETLAPSPGFREAPVTWLAENLGQAVPTMVPVVAGALAGGPLGALAAGGAMGVGDIRGELEDAGMEPGPGMSALTFGGAIPYAAAESLVPGRIGGQILKGGAAKGFGPLFQAAMRSGVEEGVTEGAQSVISQGAAAIGTGQDIDWGRIGEEALRGAAAGPFLGAGGQAVASARQRRQEPVQKPVDDQAQATTPGDGQIDEDVTAKDPWEDFAGGQPVDTQVTDKPETAKVWDESTAILREAVEPLATAWESREDVREQRSGGITRRRAEKLTKADDLAILVLHKAAQLHDIGDTETAAAAVDTARRAVGKLNEGFTGGKRFELHGDGVPALVMVDDSGPVVWSSDKLPDAVHAAAHKRFDATAQNVTEAAPESVPRETPTPSEVTEAVTEPDIDPQTATHYTDKELAAISKDTATPVESLRSMSPDAILELENATVDRKRAEEGLRALPSPEEEVTQGVEFTRTQRVRLAEMADVDVDQMERVYTDTEMKEVHDRLERPAAQHARGDEFLKAGEEFAAEMDRRIGAEEFVDFGQPAESPGIFGPTEQDAQPAEQLAPNIFQPEAEQEAAAEPDIEDAAAPDVEPEVSERPAPQERAQDLMERLERVKEGKAWSQPLSGAPGQRTTSSVAKGYTIGNDESMHNEMDRLEAEIGAAERRSPSPNIFQPETQQQAARQKGVFGLVPNEQAPTGEGATSPDIFTPEAKEQSDGVSLDEAHRRVFKAFEENPERSHVDIKLRTGEVRRFKRGGVEVDPVYYHGGEVESLDQVDWDGGLWTTSNPELASRYTTFQGAEAPLMQVGRLSPTAEILDVFEYAPMANMMQDDSFDLSEITPASRDEAKWKEMMSEAEYLFGKTSLTKDELAAVAMHAGYDGVDFGAQNDYPGYGNHARGGEGTIGRIVVLFSADAVSEGSGKLESPPPGPATSPDIFTPEQPAAEAPKQERPAPPDVHPLVPASTQQRPLAATAQVSEKLRSAGIFSEGTATEAPKATTIVRDLQKVLRKTLGGLKVAEGKVSGRGMFAKALAKVNPRSQVVRSVSISDVAAIGHEYGHLMQKALLGGTEQGGIDDAQLRELPGAVRGELEDMAQGISDESLAEGWAEYWRRYIDNPKALETEAPNVHEYIEGRLGELPGVRNAWLEAREQWQLHRDASPEARVRSHISVGEGDARLMSVNDKWWRLRTNTVDDLAALQRLMQEVEKLTGKKVAAEQSVEDLARLTRSGYMGVADLMIGEKKRGRFVGGVLKFGTADYAAKSLTEVLDPVASDLDEFRDYMVSRRAVELHERDKLTGIRDEDAKWTIEHLEEKHGDTFKQAFDDFQDYNDAMLRYLVDSGVLSEDSYAAIKEHNRNYVPFHRVMDGQAGGLGGGSGFGSVFSPVKRLKGSGRDIVDPIEATMKNTFAYAQIAGRQQVSTALASIADMEGMGELMEKVLTPMRPQEFTLGEIEGQLKEVVPGYDEIADTASKDELLAVFRPGDYHGKPNMISVLKDGKRQWFEVDTELYEALEGLNTEHMDMISRGLASFAKVFRAGITLNPAFMVANVTRDVVSASVTSKHGFTPLHFVRGFMEALNKGEHYQEFMASGAGRSTLYGLDRDSVQRKVRKMAGGSRLTNFLKDPLDLLRAMTELTEQATRIAEFMLARKAGAGLAEAGRAAQEVSTNFDRHGAKMSALRAMSAFWNPALQGMDMLARNAKTNPVRVSAKMFAYVTVPSMILYALNRDDEDYWEQPDYIRDTNWLIPFRDDKGERMFLKVPKPHEIGIWGGSAMERVLSYMDGKPHGAEDLRRFLWRSASTGSRGMIPQPTAITALAENMTNYNLFTERPIVPRSEQDVDPRKQGKERTSRVAQGIAQVIGASPYKIDHVMQSWTGGLGKIALDASSAVIDKATGKAAKPARTASDIPSLGTFFRRPGRASHSVERMYRAREKMESVNATRRLLIREQRYEELGRFLGDPENQKQLAMMPAFNGAADTLAKLRSRQQMIRRDQDMKPDAKREAIDRLDKQRIEVVKSILPLIRDEGDDD